MANILFWDSEWTPALTYSWTNRPKFLPNEMLVEEARLLCFGVRFYNQKRTTVVDERAGYIDMLTSIRDFLDQADMVVSYNGKSFDTKKINGEFMKYGISPPSPYKEIDLYREVKRNSYFYSGKLDFVSQKIMGARKVDTGGFQLWLDVMAGDEKAWRRMIRYQKQDVDLLVDLFEQVKAWIKFPHPVTDNPDGCRACGGLDLRRRGFAPTLNGKYQRLRCEGCGKWQRGPTRIPVTDLREVS